MERFAPFLFLVIGLAMLVVAAMDYLSGGVASTFVILGSGLIALGGLLRLIEGVIKLGPQGVEFTLRQIEAVKEVVAELPPNDARVGSAVLDSLKESLEGQEHRMLRGGATPSVWRPACGSRSPTPWARMSGTSPMASLSRLRARRWPTA
jgi:hypothetical protein